MGLALISLLTGLAISAVAIYYSVVGLTAIFAAAAIPIMVMGVALEVAKLVATVWLKQNWKIAPSLIKAYLVAAVGVLMFITSMGIFGFLSKAHMDQSLVSGDVQSKIAIYDDKIKTAKENIEANRKQLKQMDEAVDQVMARSTDEKGADKANAIRRSQQRDRVALAKDIEANQKLIASLNDEAAPIRAEVRKVEAEVGPIKYIAAFVYGDNPDANILERAVTWVIVIIVFVFDPLAVVLLLAAQYSFARLGIGVGYEKEGEEKIEEEREARLTLAQRLAGRVKGFRQYVSDSFDSLKSGFKSPLDKKAEGDSPVGADVVGLATVTEPVGVIAQEVAEVVPEAVYQVEDADEEEETYVLDINQAKDKLAKFVESLQQTDATEYAKLDTSIKGFDVPKVNSAIVPENFIKTTLNVTPTPAPAEQQKFLIPAMIEEGVDAWNKMLEEAERAVLGETKPEPEKEFPANPFLGQQVKIGEENFVFNGKNWIFTPVSGESKFQLIPELEQHIEKRDSSYVQNEEQTESNLWQEARKNVELEEDVHTLSQEDYQIKVQRAVVRELVKNINDGKITADDLTDEEAKAVEEYLKENNDGKDNANQSA